MAEFSFYAYTDFEYQLNRSQSLVNLPISPFQPTKRTTTDENSHELNVPYTVVEILVAVFAIVGNLMVVVVFQRERKLRRRTNYYIVSLAMADFLVGSLGVPFAILASIGLPTNLFACLFTVSLLVVLCTISIFCLVAVSVDRYWAILYPMAYSRNVRTKTAIIIISMCWVAGTVVGFLPLFGWHADVEPKQTCLFTKVMDYNYLVFLYFATIITPALLMLAFYAHIYRVIVKQVRQIVTMNPVGDYSRRSSTAQIQMSLSSRSCHGGTMLRVLGAARKRDVKATQNLSIIVLFFMICWIPLYTINCIKAFCPDCYVHPKLTLFCIILSHLNSAVNPVLYAYHLKDFRAALKNLLLKLMGVEIDQPLDAMHRFSLASQHRLQTMDANMRQSLQPRIYIDSPIWLRQQQQQTLKNSQFTPTCGVVTPCLNNIHQTVAAVASVTSDIEREMWNIVEASSAAEFGEVSYEFPNEKHQSTPSPPPLRRRSSLAQLERCDSPYSYQNQNYSSSPLEADFDEHYLPTRSIEEDVKRKYSKTSPTLFALRDKLHSDEADYHSKEHSSHNPLTDSPYSDYEVPKEAVQIPQANGKLSRTTPPHNTPERHIQPQRTPTKRGSISQLSFSTCNAHPPIYFIDTETNLLSPGHKPKFRKTQRSQRQFSANTKPMNRSCSYTSDSSSPTKEFPHPAITTHSDSNSSNSLSTLGGRSSSNNNNSHATSNLNYFTIHHPSQHRTEKISPFKAVSNFIFPPIVKHSSLFHLFQPTPTSTAPVATITATATSMTVVSSTAEESVTTVTSQLVTPRLSLVTDAKS